MNHLATHRRYSLEAGSALLTPPIARCAACQALLKAGDDVIMMPLGPGADPAERKKAAAGLAFRAVSVPVHWACAAGA